MNGSLYQGAELTPELSEKYGTYKQALRQFLEKQWDSSFATLKPLLQDRNVESRLLNRAWGLYLAIINHAVKSTDSKAFSRARRRELGSTVADGSIFDDLKAAFGNDLELLELDTLGSFGTLMVACEYEDMGRVRDTVEFTMSSRLDQYLDEQGDANDQYKKLVHVYAERVLPATGQYEYANEFIAQTPFVQDKQQAWERVKEFKSKKEQTLKRHKEQEEQEKHRVAQAESQQVQQQPTPPLTTDDEEENLKRVAPLPQSPALPSTAPTAPSKSLPRDFRSLFRYWKTYCSDLFRSASFLRLLLFVVVIVLSVTNPLTRTRLKGLLASLWAKVLQTARMGTKVSYV